MASRHPAAVERLYSQAVFPVLVRSLAVVTGYVPFSVAEAVVVLSAMAAPLLVFRAARGLLRGERRASRIARAAAVVVVAAGAVLLSFDLLWGLNYDRESLAALLGLEATPAVAVSADELDALASDLVEEATGLRSGLSEDPSGALRLADGFTGALRRAPAAYAGDALASLSVPRLPGRPKRVVLSAAMSYLGIAGIFIPFTAEANVNATLPDWEVPFAVCHELAHQRGFAREDEANYVAYLVCRRHPDADFRYSGTFQAALYALGALARADRAAYGRLRAALPPPLTRDLRALTAWRRRYESRLGEVQDRVNDAYLKSQGQREGVRSYGRMVDLLLAERRAAHPR